MQTPEAMQKRIGTVRELKAVVTTMEALSRTAIRQYENAVIALTGYYRTVELGLHAVLCDYSIPKPQRRLRQGGRGIILIGTDQGLCGRFNELVAGHVLGVLTDKADRNSNNRIVALGRRGADQLQESGFSATEILPLPGSVHAITRSVERILLIIDTWQDKHGIQEILLFYNRPLKQALYQPHRINLLPVNLMQFKYLGEQPWPSRGVPLYTMTRKDLLAALLRQYFFVVLFRACAESLACEHSARLAAMRRASKNIDEHLVFLTGRYRQQRQNKITEEVLDIVAGCEDLLSLPNGQ